MHRGGAVAQDDPIDQFQRDLARPDLVERLRQGLIGEDIVIPGPFGPRPMVYADYTASGRALRQVEDVVQAGVLPFYSNTHTEGSYCGARTSRLREEMRRRIAAFVEAGPDHVVIFCGSGATAGINRLVSLLGLRESVGQGERPLVVVGPYEHHSNILPWRESGAEVVEIGEADCGGPDLGALASVLDATADRGLRVAAMAAVSNVTGIAADAEAVTALLNRHRVVSVWDYAGGAPYVPLRMQAPGAVKDAAVFSPHKFPGGPGASGILVLRRDIVRRREPVWPGGGTVSFVSAWAHDYSADLVSREEGGTPNIVGDIRAGLVCMIKQALGDDFIAARNAALVARARAVWDLNPAIEILGLPDVRRVPIFSLRIRSATGGFVHQQLLTRLLSDRFGIQARGGCSCAGPYGLRLLGYDREMSEQLRVALAQGREIEKPGWVRLNLSYLTDDAKADAIIAGVDELARDADDLARYYRADEATARFHHIGEESGARAILGQ
jgi:selenocysteine lyase/cysteine desulfurase